VWQVQSRIRRWIVPLDAVAEQVPGGGAILELGCGEGLVLERLAGRAERLVGVDFDPRKLEAARRRMAARPEVHLELADALRFLGAQGADTFRSVLVVDTLSSFEPEAQRRVLAEAYRVLQPGGLLLVKAIDGDAGVKTDLSRLLSGLVYRLLKLSLSHDQSFSYLGAGALAEACARLGGEVRCRHLHRERFNVIPHVLVLTRKPLPGGA
jgi:ubiquinone/menaquinone biosynthesis C-methylase UbiE